GKFGQAFHFAGGTQVVTIPDAENLKITASLTIESWLNIDAFPQPGRLGIIFFRGDDRPGFDPYYLTTTPNGTIQFQLDSGVQQVRLEPRVPAGHYIHVAATLDDATGKMSLFINGKQAATLITAVRPLGDLTGPNPGIGLGNLEAGVLLNELQFGFAGGIDE